MPDIKLDIIIEETPVKKNRKAYKKLPLPKYKKEVKNLKAKKKYYETRLKVLNYYGGKCDCCGESRYEFLAIDHIHGDGNKHRAQLKGGSKLIVHWIVKNDYPDNMFRVLCHNCNQSYGAYGYCPHQKPTHPPLPLAILPDIIEES